MSTLQLLGKVVRVRPDDSGRNHVAMRTVDISAQDRKRLAQYLSQTDPEAEG